MLILDPTELARRARRVKLLLSDVDGVLTDNGVYYSAAGEELKRFSIRDGLGVELLAEVGIRTGFLTREATPFAAQRAEKLGIEELHLGVRDKLPYTLGLLRERGLELDELAYIGDDIIDVPLLSRVGERGIAAAPADATPPARAAAGFVTILRGGHGAFRELADRLRELREETA